LIESIRCDVIEAGEVIAKIPGETTKTEDITGGLPRVAELFERAEAEGPRDHRQDRRAPDAKSRE
jgi:hypothetical protein